MFSLTELFLVTISLFKFDEKKKIDKNSIVLCKRQLSTLIGIKRYVCKPNLRLILNHTISKAYKKKLINCSLYKP